MKTPLDQIDGRLRKVEERNRRVEAEKSWEVSWTRRLSLAALTYVAIAILMWALEIPDPLVNAIIPAVALLLSGPTMNIVKELWIKTQ